MASAVPSSAEWSAHDEEPAGFDPAKVWSYTRKVFSDEGGVEGWSCVWCLKKFKGPPNSTKALPFLGTRLLSVSELTMARNQRGSLHPFGRVSFGRKLRAKQKTRSVGRDPCLQCRFPTPLTPSSVASFCHLACAQRIPGERAAWRFPCCGRRGYGQWRC